MKQRPISLEKSLIKIGVIEKSMDELGRQVNMLVEKDTLKTEEKRIRNNWDDRKRVKFIMDTFNSGLMEVYDICENKFTQYHYKTTKGYCFVFGVKGSENNDYYYGEIRIDNPNDIYGKKEKSFNFYPIMNYFEYKELTGYTKGCYLFKEDFKFEYDKVPITLPNRPSKDYEIVYSTHMKRIDVYNFLNAIYDKSKKNKDRLNLCLEMFLLKSKKDGKHLLVNGIGGERDFKSFLDYLEDMITVKELKRLSRLPFYKIPRDMETKSLFTNPPSEEILEIIQSEAILESL